MRNLRKFQYRPTFFLGSNMVALLSVPARQHDAVQVSSTQRADKCYCVLVLIIRYPKLFWIELQKHFSLTHNVSPCPAYGYTAGTSHVVDYFPVH